MFIYNPTESEMIEIISFIQECDDPCYLGELHSCNDCGECI